MIHPQIRYCPRCGAGDLGFDGKNRFECGRCGFVLFHNTATGCGAILTLDLPEGPRILLLERANEPAKGYLDYPGGFVDPGESAETALRREIREETALEAQEPSYLHSAPNRYEYRGVIYNTCDLVFTGTIDTVPSAIQEHEIAGYHLLRPEEIEIDRIAFPSLREAMRRFLG